MATFWSFDTVRRAGLPAAMLAAFVALLPAAYAKGKRYRHPAGFTFELPDGWAAENGPLSAVLTPRGVKVDPEREDNPEVYTVQATEQGAEPAGEELASNLRRDLLARGVKLEQDGGQEAFGRNGFVYSFEFVHPELKAAFRVRIFSMRAKGRSIALIASGLRDRLRRRDKELREIAASLDYEP